LIEGAIPRLGLNTSPEVAVTVPDSLPSPVCSIFTVNSASETNTSVSRNTVTSRSLANASTDSFS
jgi:hypothetical protein